MSDMKAPKHINFSLRINAKLSAVALHRCSLLQDPNSILQISQNKKQHSLQQQNTPCGYSEDCIEAM